MSASNFFAGARSCCWTCADAARRILFSIPFFIVIGIVSLDYYSLVIRSIPVLFQSSPVQAVLLAIVFNWTISMLLWSYLRCVFTSNSVRDHSPPEFLTSVHFPSCNKCGSMKPHRAHHCSLCQTCVLKMDHHCPWVVNCVGMHNYKYFCLFLFWTIISAFVFMLGTYNQLVKIFNGDLQSSSPILSLFATILTFAFGITLIGFLAFHVNLVLTAQTTLEYSVMRGRKENPFDTGSKRANFESVFGPNPWLWLVPVRTHIASGFEFHNIRLLSPNRRRTESGRSESSGTQVDIRISERFEDSRLLPEAEFSSADRSEGPQEVSQNAGNLDSSVTIPSKRTRNLSFNDDSESRSRWQSPRNSFSEAGETKYTKHPPSQLPYSPQVETDHGAVLIDNDLEII